MSILIITHDLGIIAEMADDVAVMYASKVVEYAPVTELFANPLHPYTHGPVPLAARAGQIEAASGSTRSPAWCPARCTFPAGCKFHPRCPFVQDAACKTEEPQLREIAPGPPGALPLRRRD